MHDDCIKCFIYFQNQLGVERLIEDGHDMMNGETTALIYSLSHHLSGPRDKYTNRDDRVEGDIV